MKGAPTIVLAGADERDLTQLAEYRAVGGYAQLERARPRACGDHRGAEHRQPARPRRRLLPGRPEDAVHPVEGADPEAALCLRQRRRVGARDLQRPRDHEPRPAPADRGLADRSARDRLPARLHLHPRRVSRPVRDRCSAAALDEVREADLLGGVHRRRPPRRRRLHLRRGDRRCSSSLEGKRGQAAARSRRSRPSQGLYSVADARSTTSRRSRRSPRSSSWAGLSTRRSARRRTRPVRALFCVSGNVVKAGQLRAADGDLVARGHLRPRRRDPGRAAS